MDAARYQQVKALLFEVLDRPATERRAFLQSAAGGDDELVAEVSSLLSEYREDDFLEPVLPSVLAGDPLAGLAIANYRVIRRIGEGGMGVVYLADDLRLGRRAALKFLSGELLADEDARGRFLREARAGAALDHPNICTVYSVEDTPDHVFIAMAYYEGETLKQRLLRGPLDWRECHDVVRQAAMGLDAAHRAGIVHRDVKPGNLMIANGIVKILDFGIAKLADQATLTRPGAALGTPAYAAPEQRKGAAADHRADIWALGLVAYEMVTGVNPYAELPPRDHDLERVVVAPLGGRLTTGASSFEPVVRRAMSLRPADRYESMGELLAALDRCRSSTVSVRVERSVDESSSYRAGRSFLSLATPESFADAVDCFEEAIAADPEDPRARAGLVEACVGVIQSRCLSTDDDLARKARAELERARDLDASSRDVQRASGEVAYRLDGAYDAAERRLRRVIDSGSPDPAAELRLAECLMAINRVDEAVSLAESVSRRASQALSRLARAARVLHFGGDYIASLRILEAALADRDDPVLHLDVSLAAAKLGDRDGAERHLTAALSSAAGRALCIAVWGNRERAAGRRATAEQAGRYLLAQSLEGFERTCHRVLDARFGETDRALEYLEPYDEAIGLRAYLGYVTIDGSLTALVDGVGLIAYFGLEPAFAFVEESRDWRGLTSSLAP